MMGKVTKFIGNLSAFVLALLVLLIVYDALMRYIFSSGLVSLQELEWHLFDIVILFAISYALREDSHVRVDIFYASFSQKTKIIVDGMSMLFFVLPLSFLIVYIGVDFVILSFAQNEVSSNPGGLEYRFLVKSLMPLSFLLLGLQAMEELKNLYRKYKTL